MKGFTLDEQTRLNNELTGARAGSVIHHRIDERGIPMPDWWDDSETTLSSATQTVFELKGR